MAPLTEIEEEVGPVTPIPPPVDIIGGIERVMRESLEVMEPTDRAVLMGVATEAGQKLAFVTRTKGGLEAVLWLEHSEGNASAGIGFIKRWK
jgi:hypothetical protein